VPQASRVLYLGPQLRVGRFDCAPGHPLWRTANETGPWPLLAFPGTAVEIVQDGRAPLVANANQVVLYNPHQRYHRRLLDGRGDHCVFIGVAPSLVAEALAPVDPAAAEREAPFTRDHGPADPRAAVESRLLARHLEAGDELEPLWIEERALHLLAAVVRGLTPAARARRTPAAHVELARTIERALSLRFAEPDSLTQIAAAAGCSPFHAARVFRACTGRTIHGYRHCLRLHAALQRLDDAGADLTDLALETGFCSHSHLSAAFQRAFGAPPSRWRGRLGAARLRALAGLLWAGARRP